MGRENVQRPTRVTKPTPAQTPKQTPPTTPPKQTPPTPPQRPQRPQRPQKPQHSRTAQVQHQNKQQVHPIQKAVTQSPIPQAHAAVGVPMQSPFTPQTSPIQKGESLERYHQRVDPVGHISRQVTGAATVGWKALESGVNLTPYGQAVGAIKTAQETPFTGQTQTDTRKNQNKIVLPDGAPYDPNVAYRFDGEGGYTTVPNPMAASPQQGGVATHHDGQTGKPNYENKIMQKHYKKGHHYTLNKEGQKVYHKKQKDTAVEWAGRFQKHEAPTGQHKNVYKHKESELWNRDFFGIQGKTVTTAGIWGRKGNLKGDTVLYKAPIYTGMAEMRKKEQGKKQIKKAQDKYIFDFLNMEKKQRRKDKFFPHYLND